MFTKVQQICSQGLVYDTKKFEPVIQEFTEKVKLAKLCGYIHLAYWKSNQYDMSEGKDCTRNEVVLNWNIAKVLYKLLHLLLDRTYQCEWLHMVTFDILFVFFVNLFEGIYTRKYVFIVYMIIQTFVIY